MKNKILRTIIKKFDPSVLKEKAAVIAIIGKRATGKTVLTSDLMNKMGCPFEIVIGTEEDKSFYEKTYNTLVYSEYSSDIVDRLIKDRIQKVKQLTYEEKFNRAPMAGLVLDNCGFDRNIWRDDNIIKRMTMNGKHYKTSFIFSMQYMIGIPPDIRANVDYIFCFNDNTIANQKKIYEYYGGCFAKFSDFQEVFLELTGEYGSGNCMVIHNASKSMKIEDCIYWYKADI